MTTLVFVDDHPLYRDGLKRALELTVPDLKVFLADTAAGALELLEGGNDVDIVLADYHLLAGNGLDLLAQVANAHPSVARGLLCGAPDSSLARLAHEQGCLACIAKDRDVAGMADAINALIRGEPVFDVAPDLGDGRLRISEKRREILRLAAKGLSNKEISALMGSSERTVKDHWAHIFSQMGVSNRLEAVTQAMRDRLI